MILNPVRFIFRLQSKAIGLRLDSLSSTCPGLISLTVLPVQTPFFDDSV